MFLYLVLILFSNVLGSYICFTSENINCIKYNMNNKLILYNFVNYCKKICDDYKEKNLYKELDYLEIKYNKWILAII